MISRADGAGLGVNDGRLGSRVGGGGGGGYLPQVLVLTVKLSPKVVAVASGDRRAVNSPYP